MRPFLTREAEVMYEDTQYETDLEFVPEGHSGDDARTGAVIGGTGGLAVGAAAGALMGPAGALLGGVIGGLAGAIGSGAAVDAIHRNEIAHPDDLEDEIVDRDNRVDLTAPVDVNPLP
jgi:hypothetical protein